MSRDSEARLWLEDIISDPSLGQIIYGNLLTLNFWREVSINLEEDMLDVILMWYNLYRSRTHNPRYMSFMDWFINERKEFIEFLPPEWKEKIKQFEEEVYSQNTL